MTSKTAKITKNDIIQQHIVILYDLMVYNIA